MNKCKRLIKEMKLVNAAAAGALAGFVFGLLKAIWQISTHQYLHYKMYNLTALAFQEITAYVIYFAVGLTMVHGLGFLVMVKWKKKDQAKVAMLDTLFLLPAMGLLIFDQLLREFTYYTLGLGIERFFTQITAFFKKEIGFSDFLNLIKRNKTAFVFFVLGIAVLVFLVWVARRLRWDRVSQWLDSRSGIIRRVAIGLVTCVLLLYAGIFIHSRSARPGGPNILLIVVDCLRADHLTCYGYHRNTSPEMDQLAQEGLLFQHAYSSASWTKPSVASLFTSLYPNRHGVTALPDLLPGASLTLAEILKNEGYHTYCFIGGNSFLRKAFNFHQGFDVFENGQYKELSAEVLTDRFLAALAKLQPSPRERFFAYLHFMDVHLPYHKNKYNLLFAEPGEKGELYPFEPGDINKTRLRQKTASNQLSPRDKKHLVSLYDGQVRFVDHYIGKIVSRLKETHLLEHTLVVITSDHGEEFWEHHNVEHGHTLYEELIHVPLIMAGNRLPCSRINLRNSLIDVLPTILEQAGIRSGASPLQGTDLLKQPEHREKRAHIFSMGTLYGAEKYCCIDSSNWKLIVNTTDKTGKGQLTGYKNSSGLELYHLDADSLEKDNRIDSQPERLTRLKHQLEQLAGAASVFKRRKRAMDKETKDRLKSLGYL